MRAACVALLALGGCGRVGFDERSAGDAQRIADTLATDSRIDAPARAFAFVQAEGAAPVTSIVTAVFDHPVTAGDTLFAAFDYNAASNVLPTISDSQDNAYATAVPNDGEPGYYQQLSYAVASADGPLSITLALSGSASSEVELRILEYSGIATSDAVDVTSSANGFASATGGMVVGQGLTTTGVDELLICFAVGHPSNTLSVGSDFVLDSSFDGDVVEHRLAETPATYTPSVMLTGGTWTMFFAAFR